MTVDVEIEVQLFWLLEECCCGRIEAELALEEERQTRSMTRQRKQHPVRLSEGSGPSGVWNLTARLLSSLLAIRKAS